MKQVALSCISWNIHRGRGEDGVVDPARTRDVLTTEVWRPGTDLLVLQEADDECPPHGGILDLEAITEATGMVYANSNEDTRWGPMSHGFLGVICFVHPSFDVEDVTIVDLPGHCHRGAVILDLARGGDALRLVAAHLSLSQALRLVQMRTLGQHLFRRPDRPTLICGDLNEWRPWGGLAFSKAVLGASFTGPSPATFPVKRPLLPLDRFLGAHGATVDHAAALDGPGIRMASDHRPLAARVSLRRSS